MGEVDIAGIWDADKHVAEVQELSSRGRQGEAFNGRVDETAGTPGNQG